LRQNKLPLALPQLLQAHSSSEAVFPAERSSRAARPAPQNAKRRSSNPSGPLLKAASSHDSAVAARAALTKSAHRGWKPLPQNKKTWTAAQDNTARHNPLFGHCDCN